MNWVFFSDLDGTLLDAATYAFDEARPGLEALRRAGARLVPVTSKTAAETVALQARLGLAGPFVVEDGAALGWPPGAFEVPGTLDRDGYVLLPLTVGIDRAREALDGLRARAPGLEAPFDDLPLEAAARETGLGLEDARRASQREFDVPFRIPAGQDGLFDVLKFDAEKAGFRLTRGGRYCHLHGDADKGRAVRRLRALVEAAIGPVRCAGLGDGPLDRPLLEAVDVPVAIRRPDGTVAEELASLSGVLVPDEPGPAGWSRAVLKILGDA